MDQFEISRNKFLYRMYKKIADIFIMKAKNVESLVINPISVKFPTPHCVIIKFGIVNKNEKYEIVKQADWKDWYTKMVNDSNNLPPDFDIEMAIRHNFDIAYRIGQSS
jgi:hypothetical protein